MMMDDRTLLARHLHDALNPSGPNPHYPPDDDRWLDLADAALTFNRPSENDAWKVAQLAASLTSVWFGDEDTTWTPALAVTKGRALLAEARRQVAESTP